MNQRMLKFDKLGNGDMNLVPEAEAIDACKEYVAKHGDSDADNFFHELLEHQLGNGWMCVPPEACGALTDALILSQDCTLAGDGNVEFWFDLATAPRVYAHMAYQVENPIATFAAGKPVRLVGSDVLCSREINERHAVVLLYTISQETMYSTARFVGAWSDDEVAEARRWVTNAITRRNDVPMPSCVHRDFGYSLVSWFRLNPATRPVDPKRKHKAAKPHVCRCIIKHAITRAERAWVRKMLDLTVKAKGDPTVYKFMLQPCPSAPKRTRKPRPKKGGAT